MLVKCVSLLITLVFLWEQTGMSQEGVFACKESAGRSVSGYSRWKDLSIPYDLARVEKDIFPSSEELIINIQDPHASLPAQHSISGILKNLVSDYDLDFIALEGAEGYINTSLFKSMPDSRDRDDIAESLLNQGRMSAGEFFSIVHDDRDVTLYGVEDDALYRKNLDVFRKIYAKRSALLGQVGNFTKHLTSLSKRVFSLELRKAEEIFSAHRAGRLSLLEYWESTGPLVEKYSIDMTAYANIVKVLNVARKEKEIDFRKATRQRQKLLDVLSGELSREELETIILKTVAFKEGRLSPADYHDLLLHKAKTRQLDLSLYGQLTSYAEYIRLYHSLDLIGLYSEIKKLEDAIRGKLYVNEDERRINELIRLAGILEKLFCVEITFSDQLYLERVMPAMDAAAVEENIRELSRKYDVRGEYGYSLGYVFAEVDPALEFYLIARKRDRAMIRNAVTRMRSQGKRVAALITGGYHTAGMTDILKRDNLSYLVVTPKFREGAERPYVAVLTNKKSCYRRFLEAGAYELSGTPFCDVVDIMDALTLAIPSMARELIRGGDLKLKAQQWAAMYRAMYDSDRAETPERVAGDITPADLERILGVGTHDGAGELSFSVTPGGDEVVVIWQGAPGGKKYFIYSETQDQKPGPVRTITEDEAERLMAQVGGSQRTKAKERQALGIGEGTAREINDLARISGEREKWRYAFTRAWWEEEITYFAVPMAIASALVYSWGFDPFVAGIGVMSVFRGVFLIRKHKWPLIKAPPLEYLRRNLMPAAIASLGVYAACVPQIHSLDVSPGYFVPTAALLMMLAHLSAEVLAWVSGLEPAVIVSEGGTFRQFRYNPRKLENAMRRRKAGSRTGMQRTGYSFTYSDFIQHGVNPQDPEDARLAKYTDILTKSVILQSGQHGLKLRDNSFARVRTYIHGIIGTLSTRRRGAVLRSIEKLMHQPKKSIEVVMGNNADALTEVDAVNKRISFDAGVLKCLGSVEATEVVLAVAVSHALFGRLGSASTDSTDVRTEMSLNVSDAGHYRLVLEQLAASTSQGGANVTSVDTDIKRLFSKEIRAYGEIPFCSFFGADEDLSQSVGIRNGRTLIGGRYRLVASIGAGGMGEVYLAFDEQTSEPVAIKRLKQDSGRDRDPDVRQMTEARFEREIELARKVKSDSVVRILDDGRYGSQEEHRFFVMEYYPWPSLEDVIADEDISVDGAVDIMIRILDGLIAIHEERIIHRDIKPANIQVNPDKSRTVIMDFGLTKEADGTSMGVTMTGQIMGTPYYMSPEQCTNSKDADQRSDVWAAGVMLYEILTGKKPFNGAGHQVMGHILYSEPLPVWDLRPEVDADLAAIVGKAMEKDPADRFKTAEEMKKALQKWEKKHKTVKAARKHHARGAEGRNRRRHSREADPAVPRRARRSSDRDGREDLRPAPAARTNSGISKWVWRASAGGVLAALIALGFAFGPALWTRTLNAVQSLNITSTRRKEYDGAIEIPNNNKSFIDLGENEKLANLWINGGSVSFWCKVRPGGNHSMFVNCHDWVNYGGWTICSLKSNGNKLEVGHWFTGRRAFFFTKDSITLDEWHFVTVTYDSSSDKHMPMVTIDGVAQGFDVKSSPRGAPQLKSSRVTIGGGTWNGRAFQMEDLCVFSGALQPQTIQEMYRDGRGNYRDDPPGLIARYSFDEKSGGIVKDLSGNGNHGTIVGEVRRIKVEAADPEGKGPGAWFKNRFYTKHLAWMETPLILAGAFIATCAFPSASLLDGGSGVLTEITYGLVTGGIFGMLFKGIHYLFNREAAESSNVNTLAVMTAIAGACLAWFGIGWVTIPLTISTTSIHWFMNIAYIEEIEELETRRDSRRMSVSTRRERRGGGTGRIFEETPRDGHRGSMSRQTEETGPGREPEDTVTLGIPVTDYFEDDDDDYRERIENIPGVRVAVLQGVTPTEQQAELERARENNGSLAAAIVSLDGGAEDEGGRIGIITRFVDELRENVFRLAHPEINGLTEDNISAEIDDPGVLLGRMSSEYIGRITSLKISASSIYRARVWREYRRFHREEAAGAEYDRNIAGTARVTNTKYLVHYVDGEKMSHDKTIVPVGVEIRQRRAAMGLRDNDEDAFADKFVVVAPSAVVTDQQKDSFKKDLLKFWMLEDVVPEEDILILDRQEVPSSTSKLLQVIENNFGIDRNALQSHSGIRCLAGTIGYDDAAAREQVLQLDIPDRASTTVSSYQVLVDLVLRKDRPGSVTVEGLTKDGLSGKHFIYLPPSNPINLNAEIKAYHDYLEKIGVMA